MDLSPLKCAVADKHRVLPVFSRNRPVPIPLDATLTRVLVSVHSKQLTGKLSYLESALTENTGVGYLLCGEPLAALILQLRSSPFLSHSWALFGTAQKSTPLFSSASKLFAQNTRGGGTSSFSIEAPSQLWAGTFPSVPLRRKAFGATICKGTGFLHHPGKQLRSPRCLRIVSGHRELFEFGSLCKSCLGPAFLRIARYNAGFRVCTYKP
jgi:hypothetical protein